MAIFTILKRLSRPSQMLLVTCLLFLMTWISWRVISPVAKTYCLVQQNNRLIQAVHRSDVVTIRRLLDNGADPDRIKTVYFWHNISLLWCEQIDGPWTALETAAYEGKTDIVKFMLDHGANINTQDDTGKTPLMWAIQKGPSDTTPFLLSRGADVRLVSSYGTTALDDAIIHGIGRQVRLLISHGADINRKDSMGDTALSYAAGKYWETQQSCTVAHCRLEEATILLENGADPNSKNALGESPLQKAAEADNCFVLALLLQHGATVSCKSMDGRTPIEEAVRNHRTAAVKFLLTHGADVTLKTSDGSTLLSCAKKCAAQDDHPEQWQEIITALRQTGAK